MAKIKNKLDSCGQCGSTALQRKITTYPVRLTTPSQVAGKEIHVQRVALYECQDCAHQMPTAAGMAKVERLVRRGIDLFLGRLR